MSLSPWIKARESKLGGHEFVICAISMPFVGFPHEGQTDGTQEMLRRAANSGQIDHLIISDQPARETEARGQALRWLTTPTTQAIAPYDLNGVDYIWQVDADEAYTESDILGAANFVRSNGFITWFRIPFRNLVFTENQWLAEPFSPPRIHKTTAFVKPRYCVHSFCDDNNIAYSGGVTRDIVPDTNFAHQTIPYTLCNPKHYTWLNNQRSRKKVAYQKARGWNCSFEWDDARGGLIFNSLLPFPEIVSE